MIKFTISSPLLRMLRMLDCEEEGLVVDCPKANMEESSPADISCGNCWGSCISNPCHAIKRLIAAIKRKFGSVYDSITSNGSAGRSNNSGQQTRAVMHKALSYCVAFTLTFMFPIIMSICTLAKWKYGPTLSILVRVFYPLQGFFNFVVFIYPNVVYIKNKTNRRQQRGISWIGAFMKVISGASTKESQ